MTGDQLQRAKDILERHGYTVKIIDNYLSIVHQDYEAIKVRYIQEKDKIFMIALSGFYSAKQIKDEVLKVYEVMLDLGLNGISVAL